MKQFFTKKSLLLLGVALLLAPALLTHLGLIALYDDEGIRALVALEMQINDNLIVPTLFGEYYYNKPPLYNWILLAFFELVGRNDEFIVRLPTIFFLLLFCLTVWRFGGGALKSLPPLRNPQDENLKVVSWSNIGMWSALALLTCGRILFWDSMLGLIDICFSWVMYGLFMVIYYQGEKGQYNRLFAYSYGLAGIGFMLKALPAVLFLGLALLSYFIWQKKWRLLFSWKHMVGSLAFLIPVGTYYYLYAQQNGLEVVFKTIFNESAKRTAVEYGIGETIQHLFTFPLEVGFHFLPWTILAVYLFRKKAWQLIRKDKFVTWNLLVLGTTILPYWVSVQVYPRYLFMHVPLLFTALFFLHAHFKKEGAKVVQVIEYVFFAFCLLATIAAAVLLFWETIETIPNRTIKIIAVASTLAILSFLFWRWRQHRVLVFVLVMLTARIGFNWFILPTRLDIECSTQVRQTTLDMVDKLNGAPLKTYRKSLGQEPITGYYYTRETGVILRSQRDGFRSGDYALTNATMYSMKGFEWVMPVKVRWECGERVLIRKK